MADAHYQSTGIPIGLIDACDNSILVGAGWQDICTQFHRVHPETQKRCQESDNFIKANLKEGEPCSYKCLNGLWDIGMPVVVMGEHLATLFLGQFFYEGEVPDRQFFANQATMYGFDQQEYLLALDRVPVFARERIEMILEYDLALAALIADLAEKALQQKRDAAERKTLELRLHQAEKMQSIGRLAGGIAHDFNNMLGVIMGHAELSLHRLSPENPLYGTFANIYEAAKHSSELTRQLLAFARKQVVRPKVVSLEDIIVKSLNMIRRIVGESVELKWQAESGLWAVWIDPVQVDQILTNLCANSRDAIDGVGMIRIEAKNCIVDSTHFAGLEARPRGEYVKLSIADTGRGMDAVTKEHIFEPFFTTKPLGKGTGLGLATVYGIVTQNRGFVTVYSELEKGTVFNVYLPRHQGEAVATVGEHEHAELSRGQGQVLLVEDDENLLAITKSMLESLGYVVMATSNHNAAIELAQSRTWQVDFLLTDVVMPKMSGPDLAREIRKTLPDCTVIFMSGYTEDMVDRHGFLQEKINFIQKPFSIKELGSCLENAATGS